MFCSKCGTEYQDNNQFCVNCGLPCKPIGGVSVETLASSPSSINAQSKDTLENPVPVHILGLSPASLGILLVVSGLFGCLWALIIGGTSGWIPWGFVVLIASAWLINFGVKTIKGGGCVKLLGTSSRESQRILGRVGRRWYIAASVILVLGGIHYSAQSINKSKLTTSTGIKATTRQAADNPVHNATIRQPATINGQAQNPNAQRMITEEEKKYLSAAVSYLQIVNGNCQSVGKALEGATNGSSTLRSIKDSFSLARRLESVGYENAYRSRISGNIPEHFLTVDKNTGETHRLFQSAMDEYLMYWRDQDNAHILNGTETLKRCLSLLTSTMGEARREMSKLKK